MRVIFIFRIIIYFSTCSGWYAFGFQPSLQFWRRMLFKFPKLVRTQENKKTKESHNNEIYNQRQKKRENQSTLTPPTPNNSSIPTSFLYFPAQPTAPPSSSFAPNSEGLQPPTFLQELTDTLWIDITSRVYSQRL